MERALIPVELNMVKKTRQMLFKQFSIVFTLSVVLFLFQNCGMVRTPQSSNGGLSSAGFNHKVLTVDQQCMVCHEDDRPNLDHYAGQDCYGCHNTTIWAGGAGASHNPIPVSCNTCHASTGTTPAIDLNTHIAIDEATQDCIDCHQGAVASGFVSWGGALPTVINLLEVTAGGTTRLGMEVPHPNNTNCTTCHESNQPPFVNKARSYEHTGVEACVLCHLPDSPNISSGRLTQESMSAGEHSSFTDISTQDCTTCHRDAGTQNYRNWDGGNNR